MTNRSACPELNSLQSLVEGTLASPLETELTQHLENCDRCQEKLEQLAAGKEAWAAAARLAGHAETPIESTLQQILERCRLAKGLTPTEAGEGAELPADFLDPPAHAGHLGRLGTYEVLEVTGRGGMGVVLKAFDESLHRVAAIKVLAPQLAASVTGRKRFHREAQAAAAVRDQHVVDIHAVGEAKGLPYLVMEFIDGISLQEKIEQSAPLAIPEILRIGAQTAAGLAAAHAQGLTHRDIKPANILLENGVQRVKITDFGLARVVDDASLTQSGVIAGTPQYMAPEQARGEAIDHRADLFSLGSVLYAMCTGQPPFRAPGNMAVLKRVSEDSPPPITDINPDVPDWLVGIIDRLHAKNPADRFQTAEEVAGLLSGFLAHLQGPTQVAAPTFAPASARSGRNRRLGWLVWAAVTVLLLVAAIAWPYIRDRLSEKDRQGVTLAEESVQVRLRATLKGHTSTVGSLAFDPSGKLLASGGAHGEHTIRLWDPFAGKELPPLEGHKEQIMSLAFSRDGKTLASASWDQTVRLWPVDSGKEPEILNHPYENQLWAVAFSRDGKVMAVGDKSGAIRLWEGEPRQEREGLSVGGWVRTLAFAPDGKTLAVLIGNGTDRCVQFWDVARWELRAAPPAHSDGANAAAFTSDSRILVTASQDQSIKVWDVATATLLADLSGHKKPVNCVAISSDDQLLASGDGFWQRRDEPGEVKLWDLATRKELFKLPESQGCIFDIAFSPAGATLATAGGDKTIKLWDVIRAKTK